MSSKTEDKVIVAEAGAEAPVSQQGTGATRRGAVLNGPGDVR